MHLYWELILCANFVVLLLTGAIMLGQNRMLRRQLRSARLELRKQIQEINRHRLRDLKTLRQELAIPLQAEQSFLRQAMLDCVVGPNAFLNPDMQLRNLGNALHLVLAIPKVGGSTVESMLKRADLGGTVAHRHGLSEVYLQRKLADYLQPPHRPTYPSYVATAAQLRLRQMTDFMPVRENVGTYVYMGVRDPVKQLLSHHFQQLQDHEVPPDAEILQALREKAMDRSWQNSFDTWFDHESALIMGFAPFAEAFPISRGWAVYEPNVETNVKVLVYRLENLKNIPTAMAQMLGVPENRFKMTRLRSLEDGKNGETYRRIRATFHLPRTTLEQIYGTRYTRHFYSEEERAQVIEHWAEDPRPQVATAVAA